MTSSRLQKKPLVVWFRTYFGKVSPMLRVYENKKKEKYTDYNIAEADEIILNAIKNGKISITEFKSKNRYPVIHIEK